MPAPISITVPCAGLSEKIVREACGLSAAELHALMGDVIGAPRDYSMPIHASAAIFTATGVRNLAAHLGLAVTVIDQATPLPTHSRPPRRAQDGYQPTEETLP